MMRPNRGSSMDTKLGWEQYKVCEAGIYFQNRSLDKVILLSWPDISADILVKKIRDKFEEDWPAKWEEIKSGLSTTPVPIRDSPRPRRGELMEDVADLYFLTKADFLRLPRIRDATADKLLLSIGASKCTPFHKLLFGLGIRHVGRETSGVLAKHFPTLDILGHASFTDFLGIDGIAGTVAFSVLEWFHTECNWKVVEKLRLAGLDYAFGYSPKEEKVKANPIKGKTFMFTGKLETLTRHQAQAQVEELGGIAGSAVSKNTDYLVVGEKPGSKLAHAISLGIPRITEKEFYDLIQEATK